MRLLVYGGTLYAERRRIGDWPSSASAQFLQGTAGLSELRPAYGVGILDDSPFAIFRMMLMHERRNYPFTVLLDPGEHWADFGWNGARLLWLLFDKAAEKGSAIIKEPESFQSEQDLGRLLTQVLEEDAPPPMAEDEAAERGGERFLHLWTGALTLERPLIMGFSDAELGLAERPREAEMARRIELLPLALRGGLGWVVGGNEEYAAALGTRLIFDNSKTAEAADEEVRRLVERGRGWLSDWKKVEAEAGKDSLVDTPLAEVFSKPLPVWEREQKAMFPQYTTEDLLEDVRCVRLLLAGPDGDDGAQGQSAAAARLRDILEQRRRGPLNETIEGLYERLTSSARLDTDGTCYYLRKLYETRDGQLADLGLEESQLDREAAIEFTVERGLYPSEGSVPQFIRFEVCKRLIQREERAEDIPPRLIAEWKHLPDDAGQERELFRERRRELFEAALERTAELPGGMSCWAEHLKDSVQEGLAEQVLWRHAGENRPTWNRDYLLFGADPGGVRLLESHPGMVQDAVREAIKALEGDPGSKLSERARAWCVAAGLTELRRQMSLEDKMRLADKGLENWRGLLDLKRAFEGPAASREVELTEQIYLVGELKELRARITDLSPTPFLLDIIRMFDFRKMLELNAGIREAIDSLETLRPNLASDGAESWVLGWREIADSEVFRNTHGQRYRKKFRTAAAFYYVQSERTEINSLKLKELSDEGPEDPLKDLLHYLLLEGSDAKDKLYGKRLADARHEIEKDEKVRRALHAALSEALEEGQNLDAMFRRLAPHEKAFETFRQTLTEEQKARLADAERTFRVKRMEDYRNQIFELLSGKGGGLVNADMLRELRKKLAGDKKSEEIFGLALNQAVVDLLSSSRKANFLGRIGENAQTIRAIKDGLPNLGAHQLLDEAIAEYRAERLRLDLVELLCGDGAGLVSRLGREKNPEALREAASAAMANCLADGWKWRAVYDELMLTKKDGEQKLRLNPRDPFVKFFGHLSPAMQQRVLRAAFNDNKGRFHELVLHAFEQRQKYDKAFKEKKEGEENPLRDAVLAFLLTKPEGQMALNKLAPSTNLDRSKLDKYLRKFKKLLPPEAGEDDDRPAPDAAAPPEKGPATKQGVLSWVAQLIKPGGQS